MLDPWALANSAWKKRVFWFLVEEGNLRKCRVLHALCESEARSIRSVGLRNPIAVIPNGVDPDMVQGNAHSRFLEGRFPEARCRPIMIFVGRIHPKKGLLNLLKAWTAVAAVRKPEGWLLVIVGPDANGHESDLRKQVSQFGIGRDVLFAGSLHGVEKWAALASARAFVLPSFSEGFSVAVLEAMATGLPVLVTRQCNFDVEQINAGLVADPTPASLEEQLRDFLSMGPSERRAMGERGRIVAIADYSWSAISERMILAYRWAIGGGHMPSFMEVRP
jgi:poly(glycerol-phosphate) alpha-glucosyltransferase